MKKFEEIFKFISECLGKNTYISFMSQYYSAYKAGDYRDISRGINEEEYNRALSMLRKYGLKKARKAPQFSKR